MQKEESSSGQIFDNKLLVQLYSYTKPHRGTFYFIIFLTLVMGALGPLKPMMVQKMVNDFIPQSDTTSLLNYTLLLVGLLVAEFLVQYSHTFLSGWLGQKIIHKIRQEVYEHVISLRSRFFDTTPIGRLVTRVVSDVETLSDVFTNGMAALIGDLLQVVFILFFMFYIDWRLALVSLSMLPFLLLSTYVFKEKIKVAFNNVRNAVANLNTFVQEHISGMNIVQVFAAEKRELNKFKTINAEHRDSNLNSVLYYSIYFPVAEVISSLGIGLLIWYGSSEMLEGRVQVGDLIAFIMYIQMFFRPIRAMADRFNTLQLGLVSTQRIFKLLETDEVVKSTKNKDASNIEGDIRFENVWFAYEDENYVLKDISFQVPKGKTVALVGETGAGKSSIINLVSRLYEHNKGRITIDGTPIEEFELQSLRSKVGIVLQDVFLFSDSIRNNITLGDENISDEEIKAAAELVGAWKFIEQLGLDYQVQERGNTLSVGQRQLISFIRAMVYNPRILILDEATSSVDTETEQLIQFAIGQMMKGRTSIVIAHRLSTIRNADEIIVLEKGKIVENGTHSELLKTKGFYHNLYEKQGVLLS